MAARIYSAFPERRIRHDSGRPSGGTPLARSAPVKPAAAWPTTGTSASPLAPLAGEKPKQAGGRFHL